MIATDKLAEDLFARLGIAEVDGDRDGSKRLALLREALLLDDPAQKRSALGGVRAFWSAHRELFAWDLLPGAFLHDLYISWSHREGTAPIGRASFLTAMQQLVEETADPLWRQPRVSGKTRPAKKMRAHEPLVDEHDLEAWKQGPQVPNYAWCLLRVKTDTKEKS